jgi:hypothetical protein
MSDTCVLALEAIKRVEQQHGFRPSKPCIAYLLDGNPLLGGDRHEARFTIAAALRDDGLTARKTECVIARWATAIGYHSTQVVRELRAVSAAFQKKPDGTWRYPAPGLRKNEHTAYGRVLTPICAEVGCPGNCPAYNSTADDGSREPYQRFLHLGWAEHLASLRLGKAVETYLAICRRERIIGWKGTEPMHVTHDQLAELTGYERKTIGRHLVELALLGLLFYEPGKSSAHPQHRRASRIARVTPIPQPPLTTKRGSGLAKNNKPDPPNDPMCCSRTTTWGHFTEKQQIQHAEQTDSDLLETLGSRLVTEALGLPPSLSTLPAHQRRNGATHERPPSGQGRSTT